jgi:hypothetical protein
MEVGAEGCGISGVSDNPDTASKPRACHHFFVFTNINHISLMLVALSIVGVD